jgi:hypothetical protein
MNYIDIRQRKTHGGSVVAFSSQLDVEHEAGNITRDDGFWVSQKTNTLGVDYLVVKQCSDTVENALGIFRRLGEYADYTDTLRAAEALAAPGYDVIVKWRPIEDQGARSYTTCLGAPFLLYSSGDGRLYPCGMFFEQREEEFRMGDLTRQSFTEILASDRYWEVVEKVRSVDVGGCYANCKTHSINEFLWQLTHPPEHVNFI